MPKINLSQYQFTLRDPYQPGHAMTELEANILNYHRADKVRKIAQPWMAAAEKAAPDGVLTVAALDQLIATIAQFDAQYELSIRREDPPTPAYDHQLRIIASLEVGKMGTAHLHPYEVERHILEAMLDPNNRARARRILISHLRSIYGHVDEEAENATR